MFYKFINIIDRDTNMEDSKEDNRNRVDTFPHILFPDFAPLGTSTDYSIPCNSHYINFHSNTQIISFFLHSSPQLVQPLQSATHIHSSR